MFPKLTKYTYTKPMSNIPTHNINNAILKDRQIKMQTEIKSFKKNDYKEIKNSNKLEKAVRDAEEKCYPGEFGQ